MTSYLALLVVMSLCYAGCKAFDCEQRIVSAFLEAALDFLPKGKCKNSACISRRNISTRRALDCSEYLQMGYNESGVYTIWPASRITDDKSLQVYCDMQKNGGGWTVIQRRGNFHREKEYFSKGWHSYKEGFGDIEEDFWLGNDNIFALTNQKLYSVRFDMTDVANESRYAKYDKFWIDDEDHQYMLHIADYEGDAGDSVIGHHNKQKFTTKDRKNDNNRENCAHYNEGAWWFNACHDSNLNGLYRGTEETQHAGIHWKSWKGYGESLQATEIKIRPKNFKLDHVSLNTPM